MAVDFAYGTVDHDVFKVGVRGQLLEYPLERSCLHPVAKPLENRIPAPEFHRQVPPRRPRPGDPQDSLQKQPAVAAGLAGVARLAKAQRRNLVPLPVRQDTPIHSCSPRKRALNQISTQRGIPNRKQTSTRPNSGWLEFAWSRRARHDRATCALSRHGMRAESVAAAVAGTRRRPFRHAGAGGDPAGSGRTCRRERARAGSAAYDLDRHFGLTQAIRVETGRFGKQKRRSREGTALERQPD